MGLYFSACKSTTTNLKNISAETIEKTKDFLPQREGILFLNEIIPFRPSYMAGDNDQALSPIDTCMEIRKNSIEDAPLVAENNPQQFLDFYKEQLCQDNQGDTSNVACNGDIYVSMMRLGPVVSSDCTANLIIDYPTNTDKLTIERSINHQTSEVAIPPIIIDDSGTENDLNQDATPTDQAYNLVSQKASLVSSQGSVSPNQMDRSDNFITCNSYIGYYLSPSLVLFRGLERGASASCPQPGNENIILQAETFAGRRLYGRDLGNGKYSSLGIKRVASGYFAPNSHPWALLKINTDDMVVVDPNNGLGADVGAISIRPLALVPVIAEINDYQTSYLQFQYNKTNYPFEPTEGMFYNSGQPYTLSDVFITGGQAEKFSDLTILATNDITIKNIIKGSIFLDQKDTSKPGAIMGVGFDLEADSEGQAGLPGIYALRVILRQLESKDLNLAQELALSQCELWKQLELPLRCGMKVVYDRYCSEMAEWQSLPVKYQCSLAPPCIQQPGQGQQVVSECISKTTGFGLEVNQGEISGDSAMWTPDQLVTNLQNDLTRIEPYQDYLTETEQQIVADAKNLLYANDGSDSTFSLVHSDDTFTFKPSIDDNSGSSNTPTITRIPYRDRRRRAAPRVGRITRRARPGARYQVPRSSAQIRTDTGRSWPPWSSQNQGSQDSPPETDSDGDPTDEEKSSKIFDSLLKAGLYAGVSMAQINAYKHTTSDRLRAKMASEEAMGNLSAMNVQRLAAQQTSGTSGLLGTNQQNQNEAARIQRNQERAAWNQKEADRVKRDLAVYCKNYPRNPKCKGISTSLRTKSRARAAPADDGCSISQTNNRSKNTLVGYLLIAMLVFGLSFRSKHLLCKKKSKNCN